MTLFLLEKCKKIKKTLKQYKFTLLFKTLKFTFYIYNILLNVIGFKILSFSIFKIQYYLFFITDDILFYYL